MCRGYITRGSIFHHGNQVIGTGYQKAYKTSEYGVTAFKKEANERGTPFVEIDPVVCDYVYKATDKCVKEMFSRMIKSEREITALFPFKRLSHSFLITGIQGYKLNPQKEKESNNNMRNTLNNIKLRVMYFVDKSNSDAIRKANYYIKALDEQLILCDKIDKDIDFWSSSH
jgi:hypothetical protein